MVPEAAEKLDLVDSVKHWGIRSSLVRCARKLVLSMKMPFILLYDHGNMLAPAFEKIFFVHQRRPVQA